ncbi:MAG TPA: zinc ABC transporter substrate-binding protein [Syntrophomonadaceae bacterium]|nr:zinc ABC transporter substrate-binding protein [Syntrophomonadaceae bacterium]
MRLRHYFLLVLMFFFVNILLAGCNTETISSDAVNGGDMKRDLNIIVSILPQADLVKMLGKDNVQITVMIPPGASPDSYEPTTNQLKNLSKADMYVMVGHLPFETAWCDRLLSANPDLLSVDSSRGIDIFHGDPHIWLSPQLAKKQLENICQALIEIDEGNESFYLTNLEGARTELDVMDQQIKDIFADLPKKTFLVYHPAWGYFAKDYGLIEMAIEKDGKEPAPGEMAKIIAQAKELEIKTVFTSSQHSTRSAEAIADELQAVVVTIDPLPSKYEDIIETAKLLSEALK